MTQNQTLIGGLRRQDWTFVAMLLCTMGAGASLGCRGPAALTVLLAAGALGAAALGRHWSRVYPAPMPHALRWILYVAHPGLSARRLHRTIAAAAGARVLEIGPGIGHHAIPTALLVGPDGRVDALDIQPEMLRDLQRRAEARGVGNIVTQVGDAEQLPYADATFDAAYLITVLGEVPHPEIALRELARVLKPGGRIAVGEIFLDPDYVSPERMRQLADAAGLRLVAVMGTSLAYFARIEHLQSEAGAST